MKAKFLIKCLKYICTFLFGALAYYILSLSVLDKASLEDSNSVQDLTSDKINDIKSDIDKCRAIDSISKVFVEKIDYIITSIRNVQRNTEIDKLINEKKLENEIYKAFVDPLTKEIEKNNLILDSKYSVSNLSSYSKDFKRDDKKQYQLKEINQSEEISKVFYLIFPDPQYRNDYLKDINLNTVYSDNSFTQRKEKLIRALAQLKQETNDNGILAKKNMDNNISLKDNFQKDLKLLKDMSINKITLYMAFPLFAAIVIILFAIPRIYKNTALQKMVFKKNIIKDVITIFMLTSTIILLGLSKILTEQVIGTLLGGISVYVLEKGFNRKKNSKGKGNNILPDVENAQGKNDTQKTPEEITEKPDVNINKPVEDNIEPGDKTQTNSDAKNNEAK